MDERFIFTVSTGRCGEASLSNLINRDVRGAYAAFEEPHVSPKLPGLLGDLERHFRRRFVETDELLGRGRVLRAFAEGDDAFIERVVARRLAQIRRQLGRCGKHIFFDVSKFFVRGLHVGYQRLLPRFALVLLVRDPIVNMRSYLNRDKTFFKDSAPADAPRNELRLDPAGLEKGELYLWAWFETYLRFLTLRGLSKVEGAVEIRTDDLNCVAAMSRHFKALGLDCAQLHPANVLNSNVEIGRPATAVTPADIALFERFVSRLPSPQLGRIAYLNSYRPKPTA
jgi:hypothetical protein